MWLGSGSQQREWFRRAQWPKNFAGTNLTIFENTSSRVLMLIPKRTYNPITAMGCRQCLPLNVVQLKGKRCQKLHCRNELFERCVLKLTIWEVLYEGPNA